VPFVVKKIRGPRRSACVCGKTFFLSADFIHYSRFDTVFYTRDINKAVKNNPDKFPGGYTFVLNKSEFEDLRWKFSTTK
jgi:hypothetical protein